MLTINTNLSSLIAQGSMKSSTNKLNQAIERMTTGFKINHAKDNAANYSIATNMTTKIGAYNVAEDNAAMGLDLISTAEGTLFQIEDKLQRLRALAEQAANGTYGEQSLNAINAEANALVDEINRLYSTAEYNGIKLFEQETQIPDDPNIPKAQYDGFIKEVVRRDTSMMTTLASVDGAVDLADGTYSISTPEEMKKLADMTNAGLVSAGDEFVLANDIDLSQYENWTPIGDTTYINSGWSGNLFRGRFDGNGFTVNNIKCIRDKDATLFGSCWGTQAIIANLGIKDSYFESVNTNASGLVRLLEEGTVDNCYVSNSRIKAGAHSTGIAKEVYTDAKIVNSYSSNNIIMGAEVAGIASFANWRSYIENCFVDNSMSGDIYVAGIVTAIGGNDIEIKNSYVYGHSDLTGVFVARKIAADNVVTIEASGYSNYYSSISLCGDLNDADHVSDVEPIFMCKSEMSLQVGINTPKYNNINLDTVFYIDEVTQFRLLGLNDWDYLTCCDKLLSAIVDKQTMFGAISNRLESVLEEITIQRDNLISSRSTIRDADIAEVSSHYIQQQILQQASATLLATANQSPAIALQLI